MHLTVLGPPPMSAGEPCGADYVWTTDIRESTLYVEARQGATRTGACQLDHLVCCEHSVDVELPVGATIDAVHDVGHPLNPIMFLSRPAELPEPIGLPEGWVLQREFATWGGTWERVYSAVPEPQAESPDAVEFGVTFGGRIITEPEALQPPVEVNGAPGQYQRYPELNPGLDQIQLQWLDGDRKFWLNAFDPPLTIDDLVRLAESTAAQD